MSVSGSTSSAARRAAASIAASDNPSRSRISSAWRSRVGTGPAPAGTRRGGGPAPGPGPGAGRDEAGRAAVALSGDHRRNTHDGKVAVAAAELLERESGAGRHGGGGGARGRPGAA